MPVDSSVLEVSLRGRNLELGGGHQLLRGVSKAFSARSSASGGLVLSLRAKNPSSVQEEVLGQLGSSRFLAASRVKLWWMVPVWGTTGREVPPETQFLLLELAAGGPYAIILPLIDRGTFRGTLRPVSWSMTAVGLRMESGCSGVIESQWSDAVLVAAGRDPFELVQRAVCAAAKLSGGARPLCQKTVPPSADVFGWCTWDAFYSCVSARDVVRGLEALEEAGTPPQLLIIDDGWQLTAADGDDQQGVAHASPVSCHAATKPQRSWGLGELWASLGDLPEKLVDTLAVWPLAAMFLRWLLALPPVRRALGANAVATREHARRLSSVAANAKFSSLDADADTPWTEKEADLKGVVQQLKARFTTLRFVYAWHALHGYWAGVSPSLPGVEAVVRTPQASDGIHEVDPAIVWNPQVTAGIGMPQDVSKLHRTMHTYLSGCGVDGVKVDVQGSSGMFGAGAGGGPAVSADYARSLEASVARSFPGNHCINCMAHSTENLYRATDTAITRASDDFYPRIAASHTFHLAACAYNGLFIGPLLLPDWDMFHSQHPAALLHATARAVSGAPVYVSDAPGRHDAALLARLVLKDGGTLRARLPARPTLDTLFCDVVRDRKTVLKVWNMNHVNGVVMAANVQGSCWDRRRHCFATHEVQPPPLQATVRPHDVAALPHSGRSGDSRDRFAVYSDRSQQLSLLAGIDGLEVSLRAAECDIVVVAPVINCGSAAVAPIGFPKMLNAGGAVRSVAVGKGGSCAVEVRGTGRLLVWADQRPRSVAAGRKALQFAYDCPACRLEIEVPETGPLDSVLNIAF